MIQYQKVLLLVKKSNVHFLTKNVKYLVQVWSEIAFFQKI